MKYFFNLILICNIIISGILLFPQVTDFSGVIKVVLIILIFHYLNLFLISGFLKGYKMLMNPRSITLARLYVDSMDGIARLPSSNPTHWENKWVSQKLEVRVICFLVFVVINIFLWKLFYDYLSGDFVWSTVSEEARTFLF